MITWKNRLSRLTLSTVSLLIFAGIGAFLGAIAAGLFVLLNLALFSVSLPIMDIVPAFIALGTVAAFFWGLRVVVLHTRPDFPAIVPATNELP